MMVRLPEEADAAKDGDRRRVLTPLDLDGYMLTRLCLRPTSDVLEVGQVRRPRPSA